jgi:hypothetical protein
MSYVCSSGERRSLSATVAGPTREHCPARHHVGNFDDPWSWRRRRADDGPDRRRGGRPAGFAAVPVHISDHIRGTVADTRDPTGSNLTVVLVLVRRDGTGDRAERVTARSGPLPHPGRPGVPDQKNVCLSAKPSSLTGL